MLSAGINVCLVPSADIQVVNFPRGRSLLSARRVRVLALADPQIVSIPTHFFHRLLTNETVFGRSHTRLA